MSLKTQEHSLSSVIPSYHNEPLGSNLLNQITLLATQCGALQNQIDYQQYIIDNLTEQNFLAETDIDILTTEIEDACKERDYLQQYIMSLEMDSSPSTNEIDANKIERTERMERMELMERMEVIPTVPETLKKSTKNMSYAQIVSSNIESSDHNDTSSSDVSVQQNDMPSPENNSPKTTQEYHESNGLEIIYWTSPQGGYNCECYWCHKTMKLSTRMCLQAQLGRDLEINCDSCNTVSAWVRHCTNKDCNRGLFVSMYKGTKNTQCNQCRIVKH